VASENIEIVEQLFDCFRRRDNETPFDYYAEDIVWDARGGPMLDLAEVYHGHDGVREFWRGWLAAWEEIDFEVVEIRELPPDRVVTVFQQRNRGRGSGIWIEMERHAFLWTIRERKVTAMKFYGLDEARAKFELQT
jgi:ketosteroid isomerase-like protein